MIPRMFTSFKAPARAGSRKLRGAAAGPSCHHGTAAAPRWQRAQHVGPGAASHAAAAHGAVPHTAAGGGRVAAATRPGKGSEGSHGTGKYGEWPKKIAWKYRKEI